MALLISAIPKEQPLNIPSTVRPPYFVALGPPGPYQIASSSDWLVQRLVGWLVGGLVGWLGSVGETSRSSFIHSPIHPNKAAKRHPSAAPLTTQSCVAMPQPQTSSCITSALTCTLPRGWPSA